MFLSNLINWFFRDKKVIHRRRREGFNKELLSALLAADDIVIESDAISETLLGKEIDNNKVLQDIIALLSDGEITLKKCIDLRKKHKSQFRALNGQKEIWMLKKVIKYLKKQKRYAEIIIA